MWTYDCFLLGKHFVFLPPRFEPQYADRYSKMWLKRCSTFCYKIIGVSYVPEPGVLIVTYHVLAIFVRYITRLWQKSGVSPNWPSYIGPNNDCIRSAGKYNLMFAGQQWREQGSNPGFCCGKQTLQPTKLQIHSRL